MSERAPFEPGDRVICVDASPSEEGYAPPELIEGGRYTVYAVGKDEADQWGVFLDEMESAGHAGGYLAYRFRKLEEDSGFDFREQLRAKPKELSPAAPTGERTARAVPIPSGSGGHISSEPEVAA